GDYLLAGNSESGIGGNKSEPNRGDGADFWIVRVDSRGDTLWTRRAGGTSGDFGYAIARAIGGGFIVAGKSGSGIVGGGSDDDTFLVRVSESGQLIWQRNIVSGGSESASSVVALADSYILGGSYQGSSFILRSDTAATRITDVKDVTHGGDVFDIVAIAPQSFVAFGFLRIDGLERAAIVRYNIRSRSSIRSDSVWTFGRQGGNRAHGGAIASDGNYLALGFSRGFGRNEDFFLTKIDSSSGAVIWSRAFGGPANDQGNSLCVNPDGTIMMVGTTESFADGYTGKDIMLMKVSADGELKE
ncbi:MAG: hypothetical protein H7X80_05625, partial [bacterium]|nr:hypothetical protein [Candidatus Kapabacteria bacterium]